VAASTEILIGDADGQHVLIRPLSRSARGLFDEADVTGIDCEVAIAAGGFTGRLHADIRPEDFQAFLEQMDALGADEGAAGLSATGGELVLLVTPVDDPRLHVSGQAFDRMEDGNFLQFGFHVDRASVAALLDALHGVLQAFPVSAAPDAG
jgi:hypothetical protein